MAGKKLEFTFNKNCGVFDINRDEVETEDPDNLNKPKVRKLPIIGFVQPSSNLEFKLQSLAHFINSEEDLRLYHERTGDYSIDSSIIASKGMPYHTVNIDKDAFRETYDFHKNEIFLEDNVYFIFESQLDLVFEDGTQQKVSADLNKYPNYWKNYIDIWTYNKRCSRTTLYENTVFVSLKSLKNKVIREHYDVKARIFRGDVDLEIKDSVDPNSILFVLLRYEIGMEAEINGTKITQSDYFHMSDFDGVLNFKCNYIDIGYEGSKPIPYAYLILLTPKS